MNPKRIEIIEILGGFLCVYCKKVTDPRILEIDHINGNGKEMPLSDPNIMDIYIDNPYLCKTELQILCRNCHGIKTIENGERGRRKGEPKPITVKKEDIPKYILEELERENETNLLTNKNIPRNNLENMEWYTHA